MMTGAVLYLVVAIAIATIISFGFQWLSTEYHKMLTDAVTPWFLSPPIGDLMLLTFFKMSTLLRKMKPSILKNKLREAGLEKEQILLSQHPAPGGICFIGSSTFTFWRRLYDDFSDFNTPIINSAFGGSCTDDILPLVGKICCKFKPRVIVYFCGTNNIAQGMSVNSVISGFENFLSLVCAADPLVRVVYLGITKTVFYSRWNINNCLTKLQEANQRMRQLCEYHDNVIYVDTDQCAFTRDSGFYLGDSHHLNDEGHSMLADVLRPAILESLKEIKKER